MKKVEEKRNKQEAEKAAKQAAKNAAIEAERKKFEPIKGVISL